jgi:C4-dicarboxylate-binding protein DctP
MVIFSSVIFAIFFYVGCDSKKDSFMEANETKVAEFVLKFSHVVAANTPKGKAAIYFEKRLEELSDGRIDVQVYPSSQLYKDKEVLAALKLNDVQMAAPSFSKFTKDIPQLALFDLPFLFNNMKHVHKVQDSEVGNKIKKLVNAKGYIALNFWDNHFKQLSSNTKALIMPADAKGQKFRIMSSKVLEAQFKAVNANPQVMPFSEVYSALQTGTIDGQENTISNIYSKKFHEVQKFMTISNHGYLGYLVIMSPTFYNSLPVDLQKIVLEAMNDATKKEREFAEELNNSQMDKIIKYATDNKNLKIFKLTPVQRSAWKKSVESIYPEFYDESVIGKKLIEQTLATGK